MNTLVSPDASARTRRACWPSRRVRTFMAVDTPFHGVLVSRIGSEVMLTEVARFIPHSGRAA